MLQKWGYQHIIIYTTLCCKHNDILAFSGNIYWLKLPFTLDGSEGIYEQHTAVTYYMNI